MMWAIDCHLRTKNRNYIDGAAEFMQEPGADGTLHMVPLANFIIVLHKNRLV